MASKDFEYSHMDIYIVYFFVTIHTFSNEQHFLLNKNKWHEVAQVQVEDDRNYIWMNYSFNGAIAQSMLGMNTSHSLLQGTSRARLDFMHGDETSPSTEMQSYHQPLNK